MINKVGRFLSAHKISQQKSVIYYAKNVSTFYSRR